MRFKGFLVGSILLVAACAFAQQTTFQKTSDVASYITVFSNIGLDTVNSFRAPDKKCAFISEAIKIGTTIGISELLKAVVHEERPDKSDDKSFPSEHTAIAFATSGWSFGWGITLGGLTGAGRVAANRHHWWDTLAGGSIGYGVNFGTTKLMNCREN
jgi:membrane-associated phospholipid phosphatase